MNLAAQLYKNGEKFQGGWNFGPLDNTNYTVSKLINEIVKYDNNVNCIFENKNNNHEAKLLKLDISKAKEKLGWMPLLDFEETLKYTVEGYLSDLDGYSSYKNRIMTIEAYTDRAKKFNLSWATK